MENTANEYIIFGHKEIKLPRQALLDCHHQGACDSDCEYWANKIDLKKVGIEPSDIVQTLKEYGIEDTQEMDNNTLIQYMLWLAAGDYQEQNN